MQIIKQGLTIYLIDNKPPISNDIKQCIFARHEIAISYQEVDKLLNNGVIEENIRCTGDFLSSIFPRPKKDGSRRMILNLSEFNEYVVYQHFKMESLQHVLNIIVRFVWMASVELKDAFYSIPVHKKHRKHLEENMIYFLFSNIKI